MHEQHAFEFLALELELPSEKTGREYRQHGNRCAKQIVIGHLRQGTPLGALRKEIKHHAGNEKRDGKVDQHNVLRMLGEDCGFDVKWMHFPSSVCGRSMDYNFPGHLRMDGAEVGILAGFREGVSKFVVCIENLGFEYFFGAHDGVRDV